MNINLESSAKLLLEDGTLFFGKSLGIEGMAGGEICFNTGMTGYQEIFTDPSYFGQMIVMTNSHIGNYGVHPEEVESDQIQIVGLVAKNFSNKHSRSGDTESLLSYFKSGNKIAVTDFDTRSIVQYIRDNGAMNAVIATEHYSLEDMQVELDNLPKMAGLELSSKVSTKEPFEVGNTNSFIKVVALDFGIKKNILRNLTARGCYVKVFPFDTTFDILEKENADGYFLSNGPGDPIAMSKQIDVVKQIIESGKPVFGICLGHQLIALASGLSTVKMHNGHRGINHPVKNLLTGKCEITSQNHGFVVESEGLKENGNVELTHIHLNDGTVAGIKLKSAPVFSVQYHPEAGPGPHDSHYLFDQFVENINQFKQKNYVQN